MIIVITIFAVVTFCNGRSIVIASMSIKTSFGELAGLEKLSRISIDCSSLALRSASLIKSLLSLYRSICMRDKGSAFRPKGDAMST